MRLQPTYISQPSGADPLVRSRPPGRLLGMSAPLALLLIATTAWPADNPVSLRIVPSQAALKGARATQQFLAIAKYPDGAERDVTAESAWRLSNPALAKFVSPARLAPSADGALTLTATIAGQQAKSTVKIEDAAAIEPVTFRREILGIFTKRGCNTATCHGGVKGQGGFKLSANALYPRRRLPMDR